MPGLPQGARIPERLELLDPIRGFAACWVFAFHLPRHADWQLLAPTFASLFDLGHLGVPIFFAVSGLVITSAAVHAARRANGTVTFLTRRLHRIYPTFWASIAVVVAVPFVIEGLSWLKTGQFVPPDAANPNFAYLGFGAWDWVMHGTLLEVFAAGDVPNLQAKFTGLNAVYWTLAIEVQFYLLMTMAVAAGRYLWAVLAATTVLGVATLLAGGWQTHGIFLPYWPMFALGAGVFVLFERGVRLSRLPDGLARVSGTLALIAAVATVVVAARQGTEPPRWQMAGAVVAMLFAAEALEMSFRRARSNGARLTRALLGVAVFLGSMSYSVYLLHGRVQFLSDQFVRQVAPTGVLRDIGVFLVTLLACGLFYRLIERPLMARAPKPGKLPSRPPSRDQERCQTQDPQTG